MASIAPVMETQAPPELDLRRYIDILRRRKLAIGFVVVVMVGVTVLFSARQTPVYEAQARVLLRSSAADQLLDQSGAGAGVATEIQVMESEAVREAVRDVLGYVPSVSFSPVSETSVVVITARADSAQQAAESANGYAEGYITWRRGSTTEELTETVDRLRDAGSQLSDELLFAEGPIRAIEDQIAALPPEDPDEEPSTERQQLLDQRDELEAESAENRNSLQAQILANQQEIDRVQEALSLLGTGGTEVLTPARAPSGPVSPKPLRNGILALAIGLVLGILLALVLEVLDDRIRRKEDLVAATGDRSVLGLIPTVGKARRRGRDAPVVVSSEAPNSPAAEAYRTLRTSVQFLSVDEPVRVIQVTSPNASEGKTTTVANLGLAMARAGQRVVVVCCDLRRPRVHEFYGVDNAVGFTSVLLGDATLETAVQEVPGESRLHILASGPPPPNPAELLSSKRTHDVLEVLAQFADVVIVDTPPVLPVTDALVMSSLADVTILVAKAGSSNKRAVRHAVELLDQVDANLVGSVLNGAPMGGAYGYGGGYGYGSYTYSSESTPERSRSRRKPKRDASAPAPASDPLERAG